MIGHKFLGIQWQDKLHVDAALPFGLRSAPKIFTALADAVEWIAQDSIPVALPAWTTSSLVELVIHRSVLYVCKHLGVPLAEEKLEGPSDCLVFFGIVIDTVRGELRRPVQKLERLQSQLVEWRTK